MTAVAPGPDGAVSPEDPRLDAVAHRCFDGAHTLVVGPAAGCARIEVRGEAIYSCPNDGWAGAPVRIVRLGDPLVRLKVLPRCEGCAGVSPTAQVLRMLAFEGPSHAPISHCESCDDTNVYRVGDEVVGFARSSDALGFETLAFDDTVELVLVGPEARFEVEACAVPIDASIEEYLDACDAACAACPSRDGSLYCARECRDTAALESASCLSARTSLAACLTETGCDAACDESRVRVEYECREL